MTVSIDTERVFDNIQHSCMIKTLNKLRIEGKYLNIIKTIHENPVANIIFNGEKMTILPLKSRIKQRCPLLLLLFNMVLEVTEQLDKKKK